MESCVEQMVNRPLFRNVAQVFRLKDRGAAYGLPNAGSFIRLGEPKPKDGHYELFLRPMRDGWDERLTKRTVYIHGAQIKRRNLSQAEYKDFNRNAEIIGEVSYQFEQSEKRYPAFLPIETLRPGMILLWGEDSFVVVRKEMVPQLVSIPETDYTHETYDPSLFQIVVMKFVGMPHPGDKAVALERLDSRQWRRRLGSKKDISGVIEVAGEGAVEIQEQVGSDREISGTFLFYRGDNGAELKAPVAPSSRHDVKFIKLIEYAPGTSTGLYFGSGTK